MCAGSGDSVTAVFVPVDENVGQVIVQAELQYGIAGTCDRPSVLVVVTYDQTVCYCAVPKSPIVICPTPGTVLDTDDEIVVMNHLMEQRSTDVLDGSSKGSCANVDLMACAVLADPGVIPEGEVAVGFRSGLDGGGP